MDPEDAHPAESRPPTVRDLLTIDGVPIPFASTKLLLRTKQTHRDKDVEDRLFLQQKIASGG
jgi:hypothetical protein